MQHFRSLEKIHLQDAWLTIGSFDGVHRGHQKILQKLTTGARSAGAPVVVLTFDPHPIVVLRPEKPPSFLTTPQEKARLLGKLGVDIVVIHPFDREVASHSARAFLSRLKAHLNFTQFWVGYDFAMGQNREGDIPALRRLGAEMGYELKVISPVEVDGQVISSSQIRALLTGGQVREAFGLLGRPYRVGGMVIEGAKRGHTIGIPTANLDIEASRVVPYRGVYVCQAHVNGQAWDAVANIGIRPTFESDPDIPSVEAHLLDFSGDDLYGKVVQLDFITRLRGEQKFPNVQTLIEQIHTDIARAREILA
ncbi:MAG: bifunctional riboflavin kinase/FAD synthetase [Anaerolineales bacterium]